MAITEERLQDIIARTLGFSPEYVVLDARFAEDLGVLLVDKIKIVIAVKLEFSAGEMRHDKSLVPSKLGHGISVSEINRIKTVRDLLNYFNYLT